MKNMQLNQSIIFIVTVFMLVSITACTSFPPKTPVNEPIIHENDIFNDFELDEITMTHLNKTRRYPIQTTISLVNSVHPIISYTKKIVVSPHHVTDVKKAWGEQAFQKIEESWYTDLTTQDFVYIEKICKEVNLFTQSKIHLSDKTLSKKQCVGKNTVSFYVRSLRGYENTLAIPHFLLCQAKHLPKGFNKLMGEMSALIPKYQPHLETKLALR
ncbi:hypothetical protein QUF82_22080 [Thiotrichales bacterium HSG14]|nr:hypothetical protein [Thiotrichales bacterium HSG14]